ncbi:MAG: polysaccharide deacetylase family protein [Candidatus Eisenbacteria bacterium]|nr:polysaccharide deacetylase family protein [Candidatus Eisenbacteria bacterium]
MADVSSEARAYGILTVDYEDWFHIADPTLAREDAWAQLPLTVEADTLQLLDLLDEHRAKATFFVVGWLAERTPDTLREITRRGHRLAIHGFHHVPPNFMSEAEFREDVRRCLRVIKQLTSEEAEGYRAPFFGVRGCSYSYIDVLRSCGLRYDASVFAGFLPGRGQPFATAVPQDIGHRGAPFWEVPISVVRLLGVPMAFSGGGFLRLLPAWFVQWCCDNAARRSIPVVYYVHPRDLNPKGPTAPVDRCHRLRYYGRRESVARKLEGILRRVRLVSVEEFVPGLLMHAQCEMSRTALTSLHGAGVAP